MTAKRILIVEDEKAIRDMVAFGLRRAGYEVREAEDCREARARIVDVRPDLMLVDWMLPDMSGLELTRSLKRAKDTEEIPVIMLTARSEEQDKVGGLEGRMTTSPNPSRRVSCWRAFRRCCAEPRRPERPMSWRPMA